MQPVALCDSNWKQVLLVTKVPSAWGAPWAGEGTAWGVCGTAMCCCESVVPLTGCKRHSPAWTWPGPSWG